MSFPRYPKYKDSGVEWLGQVPEHWELKRFKQVFCEREERSKHGHEVLLSVSAYTGVSPRADIIEGGDFLSRAESLEGYKICRVGDLVMNIMLAWNRGLAFTNHDGIVSPAYAVFEQITKNNATFLDYLVRSDQYTLYFKAFSTGVIDSRLRLYPEVFGRLFCSLPPIEEQIAIGVFLDRETKRIDQLIAEQEQLLQLLWEKRRAIVSGVVLPGPNEKTTRLGHVVDILPGFAFSSDEYSADGGAFRLLRGINVGVGACRWDDTVYWNEPLDVSTKSYVLDVGDIVLGMDRPWISEGTRAAQVSNEDLPSLLVQRVARIRSREGHSQDFVLLLLRSDEFRAHLEADLTGVSVPHISEGQIASFRTRMLPRTVQEKIASETLDACGQVEALVEAVERAIALLAERRTALISAAVTGKIDVRNVSVAAELPAAAVS